MKNVRLAKTQLKQFSGVNFEDNLDSFDSWAEKFSKLPMYYLTFHGANEVIGSADFHKGIESLINIIIDGRLTKFWTPWDTLSTFLILPTSS